MRIIDDVFVKGTAGVFRVFGKGLNRLQNGDVQAYVTAVAIGLAAFFVFIEALG